jgi:hypothetical protein
MVLQAEKATDFFIQHSRKAYVVLLAGSGLALAYNLVHYMVIQRTSAVTTTVLGEVKIVALLILSAAFLSKYSTTISVTGYWLVFRWFVVLNNDPVALQTKAQFSQRR